MHPGFRYHLASLMAVFFSLILGILIGGALFQDSRLVEEQGLIISQMEQHFHKLQANLVILEEQLDFNQRGWTELRDPIIKDKLEGKSMLLVDGNKNWNWNSVEYALKTAGASFTHFGAKDLASYSAGEDLFLVVKTGDENLSPDLLSNLERLVQEGIHLTFIWTSTEEPNLGLLPASLQIDCVDTVWGELALIFGLVSKTSGHYGISPETQGLFP